ncbi:hypothetical protein D3C75_1053110 [compost metagenome]
MAPAEACRDWHLVTVVKCVRMKPFLRLPVSDWIRHCGRIGRTQILARNLPTSGRPLRSPYFPPLKKCILWCHRKRWRRQMTWRISSKVARLAC